MEDNFNPIRLDAHKVNGVEKMTVSDKGRYVGYLDFLEAKQSRDHWKAKALQFMQASQQQEIVIQERDREIENILTTLSSLVSPRATTSTQQSK